MKVDIAIPDLPKFVENAASVGEPAAMNARFYKGITRAGRPGGSRVPGRQLARGISGVDATRMEASVAVRRHE